MEEAKKAGWIGAVALLLGTVLPFIVGVAVAWAFGYRDAVSMTTIGAGAITYIVGPVTGGAIGATSDVMALSFATGVIKAILVMVATPVHCTIRPHALRVRVPADRPGAPAPRPPIDLALLWRQATSVRHHQVGEAGNAGEAGEAQAPVWR